MACRRSRGRRSGGCSVTAKASRAWSMRFATRRCWPDSWNAVTGLITVWLDAPSVNWKETFTHEPDQRRPDTRQPVPEVPPPPVVPPPPPAKSSIPVNPPAAPKLQGIFYSAAAPTAIVDGKTVGVGDQFRQYRVKEITKQTVTLVGPDGKAVKIGIGN